MTQSNKRPVYIGFDAFCQKMEVFISGIKTDRPPDYSAVSDESLLGDEGIDSLDLALIVSWLKECFGADFVPEELSPDSRLTFGILYTAALGGCFQRFVAEIILEAMPEIATKIEKAYKQGGTLGQAGFLSYEKNDLTTLFFTCGINIDSKDICLAQMSLWQLYRLATIAS